MKKYLIQSETDLNQLRNKIDIDKNPVTFPCILIHYYYEASDAAFDVIEYVYLNDFNTK